MRQPSNLPPGCTDADGNDLDCICTRVCDCQSPPTAISNECPVHNNYPQPHPECLAGEHWFESDDPETVPPLDIYAELTTLREQVRVLREACECGVMQLDITAAPIEDMADRIGSQSWRDIADGCRKQSAVISRALEATKETT